MRFAFATLLACLGMHFVSAQTDTFTVRSVTATITVVPNDSWFYVRENYAVKITFKSKNALSRVELKGGTATQKDSLYVLRAEGGGEVVLVVYEKLKNGKEQVALSKTYKLYARELPQATIDHVANDSVVDKLSLIGLGKLRAKTKYGQQTYRVDSFCLYVRSPRGGMDTLWSQTGQMTLEMKRRVDSIDVKKSGGLLIYDCIHATSPDGKDAELPPLRVFLSPESRMRFGL